MGANAKRRRKSREAAVMSKAPRHLLLFSEDGTLRHLPGPLIGAFAVGGAWDTESVREAIESHVAMCGEVPIRIAAPDGLGIESMLPDVVEWSQPRSATSAADLLRGTALGEDVN